MILVKEMPTSGQFVAVWKFRDQIWSDTYKWEVVFSMSGASKKVGRLGI